MSKQEKQKNITVKIPQQLIDRRKVLEKEIKRLKDGMDQVNARLDELAASILLMQDLDIRQHQIIGLSTDGSEMIVQKIEEDNGKQESKPTGKSGK